MPWVNLITLYPVRYEIWAKASLNPSFHLHRWMEILRRVSTRRRTEKDNLWLWHRRCGTKPISGSKITEEMARRSCISFYLHERLSCFFAYNENISSQRVVTMLPPGKTSTISERRNLSLEPWKPTLNSLTVSQQLGISIQKCLGSYKMPWCRPQSRRWSTCSRRTCNKHCQLASSNWSD